MIPRPKPGESEDDLLKFQQEFLASQNVPSASVVKPAGKRKQNGGQLSRQREGKDIVQMETLPSSAPNMEQTPPVKKSRFRTQQDEKKTQHTMDAEQLLDEHDTHMAAVLTKIIERDTQNAVVHTPGHMKQAFPSVFHRGEMEQQNSEKGKKKSLFAQQFSKMGAKDFGVIIEQECAKIKESAQVEPNLSKIEDSNNYPHIIEGTGLSATFGKDEAMKIHQENLHKISEMSTDEILEEQKKLLQMLDPKLISFLKSKKNMTKADEEKASNSMEFEAKEKKTEKESSTDELELPIKPHKDWVHMDSIEYDKLSWMKDLPTPTTDDNQTGKPARFDFHGNLLPADSDIPVHIGLHHHGDEPERAGYTLEELFQLVRSTNLQQRVLALNTLANVLKKAKLGELEELIQTPILPTVINAGIVFLLRWALDDTTELVMSAAVSAIFSLLVNTADEIALDRVFSWYQGHVMPSRCPVEVQKELLAERTQRRDDDDAPEESDADVLKKDVIMCLVTRMNFLQRVKYILEKCHLQAPSIIQILGILTRIAHHSVHLAYQIVQCSGLLELIFQEFLPTSWEPQDTTKPINDVYGFPIPAAMKLIRSLCQTGTNICALLLTKFHLQSRLLRYLVDTDPRNLQLPETEAYHLQTESLRTWKICLLYGHAVELYIDLFSSLTDRLQLLQQTSVDALLTRPRVDNCVALLGALEAVLHVASKSAQKTEFQKRQNDVSMEVESSEVTAIKTINWGHVADLITSVMKITEKLIDNIIQEYQFKKQDLQLCTACISFITAFHSRWANIAGDNTGACLQQIEDICNKILIPCWKSFGFRIIIGNLSQFSNILNPPEVVRKEIAVNLPELGSSTENEEHLLPVARSKTPYGFVIAVLHQIYRFCQIHKGIQTKILHDVVNDADLRSYMRKIVKNSTSHLHSNYFTRFENILQYFFLKLYLIRDIDIGEAEQMLQSLALHLLTRLHHGDEYLAHDMLSTVLYNPKFWRYKDEDDNVEALASIQLSDIIHLQSATSEEINLTKNQLLRDCSSHLTSIRTTYLKAFSYSEVAVIKSRNRYLNNPFETKTFLTSNIGECLFPKDWMYVPLIDLYNKFSSVGADVQNALSGAEIDTVANVLRWIYLLECHHQEVMTSVSVTLKISRIMCAFLTGNDLFLDKWVHSYLAALLRCYTKPSLLDQMDFEEEIPGLLSFYDLYIALLQQYEAVSFGDSVFGCYILIPLQQKHNLQLRKAVWTENCGILRTLLMPIKELLIPIERYLYPEESDIQLIRLYVQGLLSESVRPKWSPILYLVTVHHVNRFIYTQDNKYQQLKKLMMKQIVALTNKELQHHLLYYKTVDITNPLGMEFYKDLPTLRKKLIDSIKENVT